MGNGSNEELLRRREFFKKATKTVLPVMAAIAMPSFWVGCSKSSDEFWDDGDDFDNNGYCKFLHNQSMRFPYLQPYTHLHKYHCKNHSNVTYKLQRNCSHNSPYNQKNMMKHN